MKSVAIYCRVSTQEQAAEGYSIGEQQARLTKFCDAHDWKIAHIYSDPGFSGAKLQRPALQRMINDCAAHVFDVVLVYKLDRLSRSQKDTLYLIEDVFNVNNISLVSMCENFDTLSPFGRAMIGILSVFAQLERDQITERMTMGRIGRAKAGYFSGGSRPPIGYDRIQDPHTGKQVLVINEYEAAQVRKIYSLFLDDNMTFKAITQYMHERYRTRYGDWSYVSSVSRLLHDRVYVGEVSFSGKWYAGAHEPIIDREIFDRAQQKYELYMQSPAGTFSENFKGSHLLTGFLYCGKCGGRCHVKSWRNHGKNTAPDAPTKRTYRCSKGCGVSIRMEELDSSVIEEVKLLSLDPVAIQQEAAVPDTKPDPAVIESRLRDLEKQEGKLIELFQIDSIDLQTIKSKLDSIHKEQDALKATLAEEPQEDNKSTMAEVAADALSCFDTVFTSGSLQEQRNLLRALINKIVIYPDHADIHWTFKI